MITKIDYLIGGLVGFLIGIAAIPTAFNLGAHSALVLLLLPWAGAVVFAAGMWVAGVLARRMAFLEQFSKFVAVGFLNTAIDFGVLNLLSRISGVSAGFILGGVNIPGFVVAVCNSYFWNKFWVFQDRGDGGMLKDFPKFFAVTTMPLIMPSPSMFNGYRSTSPSTMSTLPRTTITSATERPRHMSSKIVRLIRLGGRTRYR